MLNYQRNRGYNRGTPTSCAVSIFGLGVVLTLAGIVLMVITKNSRQKDKFAIEPNEDGDRPSFNHNVVKLEKAKDTAISNVLKRSGPIVLGIGITVIALFFLTIIAVAWGKASTRTQLPTTSGASPAVASAPPPEESHNYDQSQYLASPSLSSSHVLVPKSHSGQPDDYNARSAGGQKGPLLENPPSYDEIYIRQKDGESSRSHDVIRPKPV